MHQPPKPYELAKRLRAGESLFTAWMGIPEPLLADMAAREGFDAVTFDMQHSSIDLNATMRGISAVNHAGKPAGVRVALDAFGDAARLLDVGAEIVIAPMINSVADARRFASAVKYPPLGDRSWGGNRFQQLTGMNVQDYLREANSMTVSLAMIETTAALDAVDDILAVPGIDGVFAGPSDLSITLLKGEKLDPHHQIVKDAFARIMTAAKKAGKLTGCYAPSYERAKELAAEGWGFITLVNDTQMVRAGAQAALKVVRG
ncbi:HpcH/HpaI aldolase family protein [Phreatobacter sp.]|uniref:HpcH/HpaI aldolase family protein n=1 Tax=Phreatobacter sp. TaxID=1966341 RepID=UPI003F6EE322